MKIAIVAVTCALLVQMQALAATPAPGSVELEFPYAIEFEAGAQEFAPGDQIIIKTLRGDRKHLEKGGRYLVEGTYTLTSANAADLALFATSRLPSGGTPVVDDQHVSVSKGPGEFRLKKNLAEQGWLHLSFYMGGHSHGGIYFGERGCEDTILRKKSWSDFSPTSSAVNADAATSDPANLAILAYLGKPVRVGGDIDPKYQATNVLAAFAAMAKKSGLRVENIAVDDSEFPFLLYGVIAGKHEYPVIAAGLKDMKDYGYGGSVVGDTDKGSTYFAINIIPFSQFPRAESTTCHRRLMVRLQVLADRVARQ